MIHTICTQYIDNIKSFDTYDPERLNKILSDNNNELTFKTMCELSAYNDILDKNYDDNIDNKFALLLKTRYGINND